MSTSWKRYLKDISETLENPKPSPFLRKAKPYIDSSFEGETILSVGKTIDFAKRGASGIVNIMPFTCMPGTIVSTLLKRYREENNNIPILNMAYDGQEQTNTLTRLEAFMYQAKEFQRQKEQKSITYLKSNRNNFVSVDLLKKSLFY